MDGLENPEIAQLRASNEELAARLQMLQMGLASYQVSLELQAEQRYQALHREIDTTRFITRYARRTWFMVMAFLVFATVLLGDLARSYADSAWWGLLLWASQHGDGGAWEWVARGTGLTWQVGALIWIYRYSDMPDWLDDRAGMLTLTEEAYLAKWPIEPASSSDPDRPDP